MKFIQRMFPSYWRITLHAVSTKYEHREIILTEIFNQHLYSSYWSITLHAVCTKFERCEIILGEIYSKAYFLPHPLRTLWCSPVNLS